MNTNRTALVATLMMALAAPAAFASGEAELQRFGLDQPEASTLTRAEVRAQVLQARAQGEMPAVSEDVAGVFQTVPESNLTRAQVRADVLRARANGELPASADADVAGVFQKVPESTLTRAEVRAEAARAAQTPRVQAGY